MILNPIKTKVLVVSRSKTVRSHGDLVFYGVSIRATTNLDIYGVKFDSKLTFEDHVLGIVPRVFQRIGILRLVKRNFVEPLCYFVAILHLFSQFLSIVLWCVCLLLNVTFSFLSARCIRWPGYFSITVSWRRVDEFSMFCKVNSNSNNCLFSELPSASTRVRHIRAAAGAHSFEFEVSSCRTSKFARFFMPAQVRMWNDLHYTVFDIGTLDGFKGNRWLLP